VDKAICQGCPYGGKGVGTKGPEDAPICIVGEAPGAHELETGVPFVGQAGQLLSKTLARAGLRVEDIYITNALRCRPPIGKPPTRAALEACHSRLLAEITKSPRTLVLAFGNSALRSLSGDHDAKITVQRGRARTLDLNGRPVLVVPTLHPAAVLRSPGELPKLLDDVKYAATLLNGTVAHKHPGVVDYKVATRATYRDLIDFLRAQPELACDIETSGFNPRKDRTLSLAVSYAKNKAVVFPGFLLRKFPGPFHRLFNSNATFIYHNGKYDAAFLRQLGLPVRVDQDTMLMHYVLSEGNRDLHGLKELSADLLGADPNYDAVVKKYAPKMSDSYASVPKDILYHYNSMDTDHTWQLYQIFRVKLDAAGNENLQWCYKNLIIPMSRFLQDVEHAGVWVHQPTLVALRRELEAELATAEVELQEVAAPVWDSKKYAEWKNATKVPPSFSPGSSYQLMWVLNQFGLHPKDPRTRKPSTNKEALKDLPQLPFVVALGHFRSAQKMLSTYVEGIERAIDPYDDRVHATYLIHGTATGRLSSRQPNMQNVPRDKHIRNIFQAPPGRTYVELDYSQVELRVLAYLSGDRGLWDIYTNNRDLHDEVAASLFPGWADYKDTVLGREQRIRAKFLNFGVAYGRGAESLVAEFKMPVKAAAKIIRDWWATFPQAHEYIVRTRESSRSGRPLETPLGRRRRFGLITGGNRNALENEAANFSIQATASDLTILSAMRMHPNLDKWDAHIINLVHDSILIECPVQYIDVVAEYAKSVMVAIPQEVLETELPFDVGMSSGQRWGDCK